MKKVMLCMEFACATMVYGLLFLAVSSIFSRYLFNKPIPDIYDLTRLGHGILIAAGLALVTFMKLHIRVDIIEPYLSRKASHSLEILSYSAISIVAVLLAWRQVTGALRTSPYEVTMMLGLPIRWFNAGLSAGFCLFAAVALFMLANSFFKTNGQLK